MIGNIVGIGNKPSSIVSLGIISQSGDQIITQGGIDIIPQ
jgi:hypothetical protein